MPITRALILTGHGINCEEETAEAWQLAGAQPEIHHVNDWIAGRVSLQAFHTLSLPGGFSYGDHLGSGLALARVLSQSGRVQAMVDFVERGGFVVGICNGFQVLVKAGLLPDLDGDRCQQVSLIHNDSGRFENRWVHLKVCENALATFKGISSLFLPVRHGEGKFVATPEIMAELEKRHRIVLRYTTASGEATMQFPENPNGSYGSVAGICDRTGRILGLMPHPEAFLRGIQHPFWTRLGKVPEKGDGLTVFSSIVARVSSRSESCAAP